MLKVVSFCLSLLAAQNVFAFETETQIDPYYSAFGIYFSLSGDKIDKLGKKSESEIYTYLLKNIYRPKTLVLEASFNPLPYAGTVVKRSWSNFYDNAQITKNFNYLSAITAGFEKPRAMSIFLGNVVEFESKKKKIEGKRKGYSGILFDFGDYHIKDNTLIYDRWLQGEIKIKGENFISERNLTYSFRIGAKIHDNPYIKNSFFCGFRRSRTDFQKTGTWYENLAIDFSSHFLIKDSRPVRHYLLIEKNSPSKENTHFLWALALSVTQRENTVIFQAQIAKANYKLSSGRI